MLQFSPARQVKAGHGRLTARFCLQKAGLDVGERVGAHREETGGQVRTSCHVHAGDFRLIDDGG